MYILISAIKNIRRYAGRYMLFGLLIFVVLCIGTVTFIAQNNLNTELNKQMEKYGGTVTVSRDIATLTLEEFDAINALPQVKEIQHVRYFFSLYQNEISIDGNKCDTESLFSELEKRSKIYKASFQFLKNETDSTPQLYVLGIDFALDPIINSDTQDNFLLEGRFPQADHEASLNREYLDLWEFKDVKIGSTIQLTFNDKIYEYQIVGFHENVNQKTAFRTLSSLLCPVILTFDAAEQLRTDGTLENYYYEITARKNANLGPNDTPTLVTLDIHSCYVSQVLLKSYNMYDSFVESLKKHSEKTNIHYKATLSYAEANQFVKIYQNTAQICTFFLTAVIAISAVVILIMTALAMHERRYEIGVLLSVGMSKPRIALLFAVENLIFTLAVTALAYAVGLAAAPFAADKLLEGVVTVSRAAAALPVAGRMLALAVGLSLPASLISSLAILRYKPMTILRSRS